MNDGISVIWQVLYIDLHMMVAPLCRPAKLISCNTKPSFPRSQMKFFKSASEKPCAAQLKDGERLYTIHLRRADALSRVQNLTMR